MRALADLAVQLHEKRTLDEVLSLVVAAASQAIGCAHTSVRVLDATRTRLLVTARAGRSLHARGNDGFRVGEGLLGWVAQHAQTLRIADATSDPRYVHRDGMTMVIRSFVGVPLIASGECIGVLSAASDEPSAFGEPEEQSLIVLAALAAPRLEVARLERLAGIDPLTGALNRRGLDDALAPSSLQPPLAIVMADVDRFKTVNDTHGHGTGDEVLRHVASVLGAIVRARDVLVRWGGEEFAIVLPGASSAQGMAVAERARAGVERARVTTGAGEVPVTISAGVASMRAGEAWTDVVERADAALYRAKAAGRNRVIGADDAPGGP